jgi:hypothetical protein
MKIKTILEDLIDLKFKTQNQEHLLQSYPDKKVRGELGRGVFSVVKKHKDPHMVSKEPIHPNTNSDGFWKYFSMISSHNQDSNPYFPRSYEFTMTKDSEGNKRPKLVSEKLHKLDSFSPEVLMSHLSDIIEFPEVYDFQEYKDMTVDEVMTFFVQTILNHVNHQYIKDENLIKALHELEKLEDREDVRIDLANINNIMVRTGPHGLQFVFTDPVV